MLKKLTDYILSFIYPPRCVICDDVMENDRLICTKCREKVHPLTDGICLGCGRKIYDKRKEYCRSCEGKKRYFASGKICFEYEGDIKESIHRFKYVNRREYARYYAKAAAKLYGEWIKRMGIDLITFVPMHERKKLYRGYNQAEVFARYLGKECGINVKKTVERVKNTSAQARLDYKKRKNNLLNAFKIKSDIVQYNYILVVDDIYTTGSTMNEVSRILKKSGAKEVYSLCIAAGGDLS